MGWVVVNAWIGLVDSENRSFIHYHRLLCPFQCNFIWLMAYCYLVSIFTFCIHKPVWYVLLWLNTNSSLFNIAVYPHCSSQLPGWCFWIIFHPRCDAEPVSNDYILLSVCSRPSASKMSFFNGGFRGCVIAQMLFLGIEFVCSSIF